MLSIKFVVVFSLLVVFSIFSINIPLHKRFTLYPNQDSPGNNYVYLPNKSIQELQQFCVTDNQCVGFTSKGQLKSKINKPLIQLNSDSNTDLYTEIIL
jgi:hypothetical protein